MVPRQNVSILLPYAEEYRRFYDVSLDEVLLTLNEPETHEGLSEDHYTVEKTYGTHRVYLLNVTN